MIQIEDLKHSASKGNYLLRVSVITPIGRHAHPDVVANAFLPSGSGRAIANYQFL